ncbi:MAG: hypothetical protein ABIE03_05085 [Patescibacteria group bacterium]|nr:hypothetical protein [Patescibacteria group bacterium]
MAEGHELSDDLTRKLTAQERTGCMPQGSTLADAGLPLDISIDLESKDARRALLAIVGAFAFLDKEKRRPAIKIQMCYATKTATQTSISRVFEKVKAYLTSHPDVMAYLKYFWEHCYGRNFGGIGKRGFVVTYPEWLADTRGSADRSLARPTGDSAIPLAPKGGVRTFG